MVWADELSWCKSILFFAHSLLSPEHVHQFRFTITTVLWTLVSYWWLHVAVTKQHRNTYGSGSNDVKDSCELSYLAYLQSVLCQYAILSGYTLWQRFSGHLYVDHHKPANFSLWDFPVINKNRITVRGCVRSFQRPSPTSVKTRIRVRYAKSGGEAKYLLNQPCMWDIHSINVLITYLHL